MRHRQPRRIQTEPDLTETERTEMPTFNDVAPSEWIKATHFKQGEEKTLTIAGWETSDFKDQKTGKVKKSVSLKFRETSSKLGIVNIANENALNKIFGVGYDLDALAGHQITLFTIIAKQEDDGTPIFGIRIKAASNGHISDIENLRNTLKIAREDLRKHNIEPAALTQAQVMAMNADQLQEQINDALAALPA